MKTMTKSIVLAIALLTSACGTLRVPDFKAFITLPASQDGYGVNVVSGKTTRIPRAEWDKQKVRGVILLSEDYYLLKTSIQKNCQTFQCKQLVGVFDELFITIDDALGKIPQIPSSKSSK